MEEIIIDGVDISECEHINACSKKIKCVILQDDVCETNPYCEGYDCYFKQLQMLKKENKTYKQALEEIKKWVTNHNPCDIEAGIDCTKEDCFECLNYDIKKITRIINEVLDENN